MENTTNVFTDGIISDMHPLTTQETQLTDALNATFVTYNGNEMIMLNDMGNTTILDKNGNAIQLSKGFVPVGIKEHGGILYIASLNKDGKGELGTIPSPQFDVVLSNTVFSSDGFQEITPWDDMDEGDLTLPVQLNATLNDSFNNPLKVSDTILTLGDCYKIAFIFPSLMEKINGKPLISTYDLKQGTCNYDGFYNAALKSLIANGKEIDVVPTTIYNNNYWFLSYNTPNNLEINESSAYLYYPNIPKGKLVTYFTLNLPKNIRLLPNKTTGMNEPSTYKYDNNKYYISFLGFTWDDYNGSITITRFKVEESSSNVKVSSSEFINLSYDTNHSLLISQPLSNYSDEDNQNNITQIEKKWYCTISESEPDLTIYLKLSLWYNDIKLGTFDIIYNPLYHIADDAVLTHSPIELQWYDATNIDENPYDYLYDHNILKDAEKPDMYVHLGFGYNKNGTDIAFIPGFVYKSTDSVTYPIKLNDKLDADIGFYTRSNHSSLDLKDGYDPKSEIDRIITKANASIKDAQKNFYTVSDLSEFLVNMSYKQLVDLLDSLYAFIVKKYPEASNSTIILPDETSIAVLNYTIGKLIDAVNGSGEIEPVRNLYMLMCILASDFGYMASPYDNSLLSWEPGYETEYSVTSNQRKWEVYTSNKAAVLKFNNEPINGEFVDYDSNITNDTTILCFEGLTQLYASCKYLYQDSGNITIESSKPMVLLNKVAGDQYKVLTINGTEYRLNENMVKLLDPYQVNYELKTGEIISPKLKITMKVDRSAPSVVLTTRTGKLYYKLAGTALFLNLDLSTTINVPNTGKAKYIVIPQFMWYSKNELTYTDHNKKIPTVDYNTGWELLNVQENLSTTRTILGEDYGNEETYTLTPLNTKFKPGFYYVNINGSEYSVHGGETKWRHKNLPNNVIYIKSNTDITIKRKKPKGYIRNAGVYFITSDTKDLEKDIVVAESVCFEEDNACAFKKYSFKHYPDNPQLKCIGWYSLNNSRTSFKPSSGLDDKILNEIEKYIPIDITNKTNMYSAVQGFGEATIPTDVPTGRII